MPRQTSQLHKVQVHYCGKGNAPFLCEQDYHHGFAQGTPSPYCTAFNSLPSLGTPYCGVCGVDPPAAAPSREASACSRALRVLLQENKKNTSTRQDPWGWTQALIDPREVDFLHIVLGIRCTDYQDVYDFIHSC